MHGMHWISWELQRDLGRSISYRRGTISLCAMILQCYNQTEVDFRVLIVQH